MTDNFESFAIGLGSLAVDAEEVTPNDSEDLDYVSRGIYVGVSGDLSVVLRDSTSPVLFQNMPNGTFLPIRVRRVRNTDTTASGIVALF